MKLDLLTNAIVVSDAAKFVSEYYNKTEDGDNSDVSNNNEANNELK
jgi:hypothetical protein